MSFSTLFLRPILVEHADADTEHVYSFDFHPTLPRAPCSPVRRRKMLQVVQILSPTAGSLITSKWIDANIEQTNRSRACFQFDRNSRAPGRAKRDTIDLVVKSDSIRRASELHDDAGLDQFARHAEVHW